MKLLIAGLVIGLVLGAVAILYFSLARFFAVQNQNYGENSREEQSAGG